MTRSKWKPLYVHDNLLRKTVNISDNENYNPIKSWNRSTTIPNTFVGLSFNIYTGNSFKLVKITEDMVGHKLGEFAPTRKLAVYKKK